jgi:hypothetical protein
MRTMEILNKYKVVLYALIIVAIFSIKFAGWIPDSLDNALLVSVVVIGLVGLGLIVEFFLRRIIEKRSGTKSALKELRHDISRNRIKAVVVIRNAPFSDLALRKQFTTAVQEKHWWDWSYIGSHPDCDELCDRLFKELKDVYIDSTDSDKIRTSSLTFLKKYPLKKKKEALVFIGDIIVPKGRDDSAHFPAHIWDAISEEGYEAIFYKLYIIESAWKADATNCTIRKIDIERDLSKVRKKWNNVYESLMKKVAESETLVYKNCLPKTNRRQSFFANLEKNVCKICKTVLFVVSPFSGRSSSVAQVGFSDHRLARFLLIAGWWLSPLSFYNDFIVNLPLTLAISYPFIHFGNWNKPMVVGAAYTLTNILGFVFIYVGLRIAKKEPKWRLAIVRTSIIFAFYLTAIAMIGKFVFEIDWRSILAPISRLF